MLIPEAADRNGQGDGFSPLVYGIARMVLTRPLRLLYGCRVEGADNLPQRGPALLAVSHSSNLDPCLMGISYPGAIRFMSKAELWRFAPLGWLVERLGGFSVMRGAADREAIRRARLLLDQGWVVGVFPEGHRGKGGRLGEFYPGVGMLACQAKVPVIPVRIKGNDRLAQVFLLKRTRVTIFVGRPVDCDIRGLSRGGASAEATRLIREAVEAL